MVDEMKQFSFSKGSGRSTILQRARVREERSRNKKRQSETTSEPALSLPHCSSFFFFRSFTAACGGKGKCRGQSLRLCFALFSVGWQWRANLPLTLMASSASMLQWSFTGGRLRCLAMSAFLISTTSSRVLPFTHSVAKLLLAIAEPHPNVLKQESMMFPSSST